MGRQLVGAAVMQSEAAGADAGAGAPERVEQVLAQGFPALFFPRPLEADFLRDGEAQRRALVTEAGLASVLLFGGMAMADWLLTPQTLAFALVLRWLVFAPVILVGLLVLNRLREQAGVQDAVLVGNIGSRERMSYTVLGDGVNVAAYMEAANKAFGTSIWILPATS